ncbi:MAG: hypothetical protein ACO3E1_02730 [Flavobacteriales bacterium]
MKTDLSNYTSVKQIVFGEITLSRVDQHTYQLLIPIAPYLFDNYVYTEKELCFYPIEITEEHLKVGHIDFAENQFDEAFYLFNSHNPVDLISIDFRNTEDEELLLIVKLHFIFEFERNGENEMLILEQKIHNIFKVL